MNKRDAITMGAIAIVVTVVGGLYLQLASPDGSV